MKKMKLAVVALGLVTTGLFAFNDIQSGSIKGTVSPADGAVRAWAVSPTDTLRTNITGGAFTITKAKPGTYQVIIEAKAPYKNTAKDNVTVADGQPTDVGEFKLESK